MLRNNKDDLGEIKRELAKDQQCIKNCKYFTFDGLHFFEQDTCSLILVSPSATWSSILALHWSVTATWSSILALHWSVIATWSSFFNPWHGSLPVVELHWYDLWEFRGVCARPLGSFQPIIYFKIFKKLHNVLLELKFNFNKTEKNYIIYKFFCSKN